MATAVVVALYGLGGCHGKPAAEEHAQTSLPAAFSSTNPVERLSARAYLAHDGVKSLPQLEALSGTTDPKLADSLRELVAVMLTYSVPYEEFVHYKGLHRLCEGKFNQAREYAKVLANADAYDSGEGAGLFPMDTEPPLSKARQAIDDMISLGAWSIPAALELVADKKPPSRLYGAEVLKGVCAWGQSPTWDRLLKDTGSTYISHVDYGGNSIIGHTVTELLASSQYEWLTNPKTNNYAAGVAETYLMGLEPMPFQQKLNLVNRLRQEAGTWEARSWEEYWIKARPVLEKVLNANK